MVLIELLSELLSKLFLRGTSRRRRLALAAIALLIPALAFALLRTPGSARPEAPQDRAIPALPPGDPIPELERRIDNGEVTLDLDGKRGYLSSLLKYLNVPVSSQTLVFSRSSFQLDLISPARPRALYFNDDVYVGWVQGGAIIEIAAVDSKLGPVFYTLSQEDGASPKIAKETTTCTVCHDTFQGDKPVPRLLVLSVLPDSIGTAIKSHSMITNDKSPFKERFGGWYVTGTHGDQRHMGNMTAKPTDSVTLDQVKAHIVSMDRSAGANVTDLSSRFDTKPYLSPHSDIVALMVLAHQTHIHNLISAATYDVLFNLDAKEIQKDAETLVEAMLFSGATPLTAPVAGTSGFAAEFSSRGPRDSRGRSLRDLDLRTRLLRYPLSYLIYSKSFDDMPGAVKEIVTRRLHDVLSGKDVSPEFKHISASDREAILEILKETKPGF